MRYLFFDIEASDGNYGICEFGFVVTDENFRPLVKKIYLINPKKPFNTVGRPGRPDVNLYYPKEEYLKSINWIFELRNKEQKTKLIQWLKNTHE